MRLGASGCVQCVPRIDSFALEHTNCMGSQMLCNDLEEARELEEVRMEVVVEADDQYEEVPKE